MSTDNALTPGSEFEPSNRRQWARYQTHRAEITIKTGRRERTGVVVDESIGGLGIELASVNKLAAGQQIDLVYQGIPLQGYVRSIREQAQGHYRVGVGWLDGRLKADPGSAFEPRKEAAHFFEYRGLRVTCNMIEKTDDGKATISLWNGSYFEVPAERVTRMTIAERQNELDTLDREINLLGGLYKLGDAGPKEAMINSILNYEFAVEWR